MSLEYCASVVITSPGITCLTRVVHSLFNPSGPVSRELDFILLMSTFVLWFGLPVLFDF